MRAHIVGREEEKPKIPAASIHCKKKMQMSVYAKKELPSQPERTQLNV
jgi:hypothetical protein